MRLRLRALRNDRGWSLEKACDLLAANQGYEVTYSHLSKVERDTADPSFELLAALARLFNVPVPELFENTHQLSTRESDMLMRFRQLSNDNQDLVDRMIDSLAG